MCAMKQQLTEFCNSNIYTVNEINKNPTLGKSLIPHAMNAALSFPLQTDKWREEAGSYCNSNICIVNEINENCYNSRGREEIVHTIQYEYNEIVYCKVRVCLYSRRNQNLTKSN